MDADGAVVLVAFKGGIGFQFKQIVVAVRAHRARLLVVREETGGRTTQRPFCVLRAHANA